MSFLSYGACLCSNHNSLKLPSSRSCKKQSYWSLPFSPMSSHGCRMLGCRVEYLQSELFPLIFSTSSKRFHCSSCRNRGAFQITTWSGKNDHTVAVVRASPKITDYRQKKVVFHQRSSSIKGHLLSKVIFYQRPPSIKGCLSFKVVFHQKSSSVKGPLASKVIFHQR